VCARNGGLSRRHTEEGERLTLTIGSHVRHGGILHHSCRANTSHHGLVRAALEVAGLTTHGELLCVIHHLLVLVRGWPRLQMSTLWWGGVVDRASSGIWIAIGSRVHDLLLG
jgi:hypothetical protein